MIIYDVYISLVLFANNEIFFCANLDLTKVFEASPIDFPERLSTCQLSYFPNESFVAKIGVKLADNLIKKFFCLFFYFLERTII